MAGKRGQATFFIIIGIIILLLAGMFFYYQYALLKRQQIPTTELEQVSESVKNCLEQNAEEAVMILGEQSGYVTIPDEINKDPESYISVGFFKRPYWYYNKETRIPKLREEEGTYSIEEQISVYVEKNIKQCLNNFNDFKSFEFKEKKPLTIKTSINEEDVTVNLHYPLQVKSKAKEQVSELQDITIKLDVRLKQIYELAKKIMEYENREMFMENITIDLMTVDPDIPFTGMEIHCGQMTWSLKDIREHIQNLVYYNIPRIRIKNTAHEPFSKPDKVYESFKKYSREDIINGKGPKENPPEDAYDYFHFYIDPKSKKTDLTVGFNYLLNWKLSLKARPGKDGKLKSNVQQGGSKFLKYLCINLYHFTYDVKYPIEVSIADNNAFNNRGYALRFAFPVLIDHNEGNRDVIGETIFESPETYTGYCDDLSGDVYDIRALGTDEYGITNMEIKDANISYNCMRFICALGKTKPDEGYYRLRTKLPSSCRYGYIVAEKDGYLQGKIQVLDSKDIEVPIKKLKKMNFTVLVHDYSNGRIGNEKELTTNSYILINMENADDKNYELYRRYPFNEDTPETSKTVEILEEDSKYFIDILLVDELDGVFMGGYRANVTLNYAEFAGRNNMVFHVINYIPKPMTTEDQYAMIEFLDKNQIYKTQLRPEFR